MASAVVLLSGGLDSSTALALTVESGCEVIALTFSYGQRHSRELDSAKKMAEHFRVKRHLIVELDIGAHITSALTQTSIDIPISADEVSSTESIPSTYVPARNIIFLSIAAAVAESADADKVVIAANSVDFSNYPDCTPQFVEAYQQVLDVGTKRGVDGRAVKVDAPLLRMSKADIVREAARLGVPLEHTWSCYSGEEKACGVCDSCRLRLKGFSEAGVEDPVEYRGGDVA
ncbi:TPA: 7-cyano-7-deazaguanine synthase QueC [Thermoplasmata archaeon]|nr:7-cyano-7-deazaguanine synthase QueC [Thermoplasmata archaeon]